MRNSSGVRRCRTSGKTRDRQVKTPPEEMHGTAFATKPGAKLFEHAIALDKSVPEPGGVFGIVSAMFFIFIERDRILNLVRRHIDGHKQFHLA